MATKKKSALPENVKNYFDTDNNIFFEDNDETERPNGSTVQMNKTPSKPNGEIKETTNNLTEQKKKIGTPQKDEIIETLEQGEVEEVEKTERYSFEIYPSQREQIEDFLFHYKKKTKRKLSASKFIRMAIENYLSQVEDKVNE